MQYAQLNESGTEAIQVSNDNIQWDANNFCTPEALIKDGKASQFRVVPLTISDQPIFNPTTHKCSRDGCEFVSGEWRYKWTVLSLTAEEMTAKLQSVKSQVLSQINTDDNRIYADVIGNKATEYTASELAAQSFKDAHYLGNVPELVQAWADAKLWTATQAADDILAQAAAWRQAASLIRRYRLKAKEDVKRASTLSEVETAMLVWNTFVKNIRTQLGVL